MKKISYSVIIFMLVMLGGLSFNYSVMAKDNQKDTQVTKKAIKGNAKKGKYFFKNMCRHCHMPDSQYKELTPMAKTMDQWKRYFKVKYYLNHKGVTDKKKDNKPVLEIVTPEMITHIKTFLIKHAADSDQPQTCG